MTFSCGLLILLLINLIVTFVFAFQERHRNDDKSWLILFILFGMIILCIIPIIIFSNLIDYITSIHPDEPQRQHRNEPPPFWGGNENQLDVH